MTTTRSEWLERAAKSRGAGRRWGAAGQRLTADEIQAREAKIVRARGLAKLERDQELARAHKLWQSGHLKPYRITTCLDAKGLEGPEVDIACGTREPDVDLWEAGKLYPTWPQVLLLAELTGVMPRWLCLDYEPFPLSQTSMRFHMPVGYVDPPIIRTFDPAAIAATVHGKPLPARPALPATQPTLFDTP